MWSSNLLQCHHSNRNGRQRARRAGRGTRRLWQSTRPQERRRQLLHPKLQKSKLVTITSTQTTPAPPFTSHSHSSLPPSLPPSSLSPSLLPSLSLCSSSFILIFCFSPSPHCRWVQSTFLTPPSFEDFHPSFSHVSASHVPCPFQRSRSSVWSDALLIVGS